LPCPICLGESQKEVFIKIFGYPSSYGNYLPLDEYGETFQLHQYGLAKKSDRISILDAKTFTIGYAISTLRGQSGCPVVADQQIIAIHTGEGKKSKHFNVEFNVGRLIDLDLLATLDIWRKELGGHPFQIND
jgi:hypothetical protein